MMIQEIRCSNCMYIKLFVVINMSFIVNSCWQFSGSYFQIDFFPMSNPALKAWLHIYTCTYLIFIWSVLDYLGKRRIYKPWSWRLDEKLYTPKVTLTRDVFRSTVTTSNSFFISVDAACIQPSLAWSYKDWSIVLLQSVTLCSVYLKGH